MAIGGLKVGGNLHEKVVYLNKNTDFHMLVITGNL